MNRELLREHRELQYLRAAASVARARSRSRRKAARRYLEARWRKLQQASRG